MYPPITEPTFIKQVVITANRYIDYEKMTVAEACTVAWSHTLIALVELSRLSGSERCTLIAMNRIQQVKRRTTITNAEILREFLNNAPLYPQIWENRKEPLHRSTVARWLNQLEDKHLVYRPGGKGGKTWTAVMDIPQPEAERPALKLVS
jgi:hypothetical protein